MTEPVRIKGESTSMVTLFMSVVAVIGVAVYFNSTPHDPVWLAFGGICAFFAVQFGTRRSAHQPTESGIGACCGGGTSRGIEWSASTRWSGPRTAA